ncbi:N-acetyltransferase family protein [Amycolatopsis sp. NPDC004378]
MACHLLRYGPHRLLVATERDRVLGYVTSSPFRLHPAFRQTVETSIYLDPVATGRGLGGRPYDALLDALTGTVASRVLAAVALPNDASVALHLSKGSQPSARSRTMR